LRKSPSTSPRTISAHRAWRLPARPRPPHKSQRTEKRCPFRNPRERGSRNLLGAKLRERPSHTFPRMQPTYEEAVRACRPGSGRSAAPWILGAGLWGSFGGGGGVRDPDVGVTGCIRAVSRGTGRERAKPKPYGCGVEAPRWMPLTRANAVGSMLIFKCRRRGRCVLSVPARHPKQDRTPAWTAGTF